MVEVNCQSLELFNKFAAFESSLFHFNRETLFTMGELYNSAH